MIDYEQTYKLKVDDPNKYHDIFFLKKEGNSLHAKLKVRDNLFTKIRLDLIDPRNIIISEKYYILVTGLNIIRKVTIITAPEYDNKMQIVKFSATLFGEVKPNSKGMVNIIIPITLNNTHIYKLTLEGRYQDES